MAIRQDQSAISLQLNVVKLAITCITSVYPNTDCTKVVKIYCHLQTHKLS